MELKDLDRSALIAAVAGAIVPMLYADLGNDTPAHVYLERAELQALILGRIAAVLTADEISPDTIEDEIEAFSAAIRQEITRNIRSELRPGGGIAENLKRLKAI